MTLTRKESVPVLRRLVLVVGGFVRGRRAAMILPTKLRQRSWVNDGSKEAHGTLPSRSGCRKGRENLNFHWRVSDAITKRT
jgi:hypothetical protein